MEQPEALFEIVPLFRAAVAASGNTKAAIPSLGEDTEEAFGLLKETASQNQA